MTSRSTKFFAITLIGLVAAIASASLLTSNTHAIKATDFQAGNIIDDAVFYNKNAMSLAQIQAFLQSKTPACDTWGTKQMGAGYGVPTNTTRAQYAAKMRAAGNSAYHAPPYICLTNYYEHPDTHKTSFQTSAKRETGMLSAAEIIYEAAQDYGINPQVILTTLKKEYSYIFTDDWPTKNMYQQVMGYACPDSGPGGSANCNSKYFGFYNQVTSAAWQFNYYKQNINSYNFQPGRTNTIKYNVSASCGTKKVYIENMATASLYIYTPYTPNDGALKNHPGTASCGAYGNRNFFMFFHEWFDSTHKTMAITKSNTQPGDYYILPKSSYEQTLQLTNNSAANGTKVTLGSRTEGALDAFRFIKNTDGTYTISNISTGKVLDVPNASATAGTAIQQYDSNGSNAQKWHIYDNTDGTYSIGSAIDGTLVISMKDSTLQLDSYIRSTEQSFRFLPAKQFVANGQYFIHAKLKDAFVIDIKGGATTNNTPVQTYPLNRSAAQIFQFSYDQKTGLYTIKNPKSGRVLEVAGGKTANGSAIQIYSSNGSCSQQWRIEQRPDASLEIISACSGKTLDIANANTVSQTKIQLYGRNNSAAQAWRLEAVSPITEKPPVEEPDPVEPSDNEQPIADGTYFINSGIKSSYVLDVAGAGKANDTNVQLYAANQSAAQKWQLRYDSKAKTYTIKNPNSGRMLDAESNGATRNGTNVHLWDSGNTCTDKWRIVAVANSKLFEIISTCDGLALDVSGDTARSGANVQLYKPDHSAAQRWSFQSVDGGQQAPVTPPTEPEDPQPKQPIANGLYTIASALKANFVLDVANGSKASGANVWMYGANKSGAQKWQLTYNSADQTYTITNPQSGKVLDVKNASKSSGTNVQIYTSNGTCAQKWKITAANNGKYTITSACSKLVLDVASASKSSGTNVQIYTSNKSAAQQWTFAPTK